MAASSIVKQEQELEGRCPNQDRSLVPQPEEDHEARCARCRGPFTRGDPWQDFCSHRFCDPCFDNLRKRQSLCPACMRKGESYKVGSGMHFRDKAYLRVNGLKAKCSFDPPCGWVGEFSQLSEHESWCENRKFCCYNCEERVIWRQMDSHVATECRHRRVTCHHCQFETTYSAIIKHERDDCPFYHSALIQHISNRQHDVMKGLWMLQMAIYKKIDSRRHLSNVENSNLVTNGNKVAERRLRFEDEFKRMRSQLEDLKNNLEDLVCTADSRDSLSQLTVDTFREQIERFDAECEKLESFKDLENVQREVCGTTVGGFGKLHASDTNELENSQSKECEATVGGFGKEDTEEEKGTEGEFVFVDQEKDNSTMGERVEQEEAKEKWTNQRRATVETIEPGKVLEIEREGQNDVNEDMVQIGSSRGSKEAEEKLLTEWTSMENNVNNEHGDLAAESKTLIPINEEIMEQKSEEKVELTQQMEEKHKGLRADDEMLEYDPGKGNEGKPDKGNKGNLTHEINQMITKNDDESHSYCCQNIPEKESCLNRNDSCYGSRYLSRKPSKHDPINDQTNIIVSNESTEPASHETKRKKKKNKKKSVDQDGGVNNKTMDSKIEQNMFHSGEVCCSKMSRACQEKDDVLEKAMEVLMREMERQTNTNGLLLKLMHNLEGRVNAIEERQNPL